MPTAALGVPFASALVPVLNCCATRVSAGLGGGANTAFGIADAATAGGSGATSAVAVNMGTAVACAEMLPAANVSPPTAYAAQLNKAA
jgi:hypothetical protein